MKKNQLTTNKSTSLILRKSKNLMGITKKILEDSSKDLVKTKASHKLAPHDNITIIGDLMWEEEIQERMSWHRAIEYAKNLRLGGYDDWRLPTKEEFAEIVTLCGGIATKIHDNDWRDISARNRANKAYQANYKAKGFASNSHWSSTTYAGNSSNAWYVYFNNGSQGNGNTKTGNSYVRCVRAGQ